MSISAPTFVLGDIFGLMAIAFIGATAVLMLLRKRILKRFRNLEALRQVHIVLAALGGLFITLHVAYFITYPVNLEIALGYASAAIALVVWVTGTAFLERFRDSLYFHGTLSLSAISMMVIHSAAAGINVPFIFAEIVLAGTSVVAVFKTIQYLGKIKGRSRQEMTSTTGRADEWLEAATAAHSSRIEIHRRDGGDSSDDGQRLSKAEAVSGLKKVQRYMGWIMLSSAVAGVYLLATDHSLWILAVSHAIGLVIIVTVDVALGVMNLYGYKRVYLASLAGALLGIVLQLGDIATAPQYNMTIPYFASYLFGLAAFDILLGLQVFVLVLGIYGRSYVRSLAARRREGKELNYSRRNFAKTMFGFAALIGFGVILGSVKIPSAVDSSSSQAQNVLASATTPITNTNNLQSGSYVYFEYPSGYPNVLFKRNNGALAAYSILCTHVCCELSYNTATNIFYCPCHGSEFDANGHVIAGPAGSDLPTITLNVDSSGNVFPTGTTGYSPC